MSVVLDTNAAIYPLADRLDPPLGPESFAVSVIPQIERLSFPGLTMDDEVKIRRMLSRDVEVVPLTGAIVERTILLRRAHRPKLPDAAIVATAIELGYELMTNDTQLAKVPGVRWRAVNLKPS